MKIGGDFDALFFNYQIFQVLQNPVWNQISQKKIATDIYWTVGDTKGFSDAEPGVTFKDTCSSN